MGVDVIIEPPPVSAGSNAPRRTVCHLEYDGGYVFLSRFLPASSSNRRRIEDAMGAGDAYFDGPMLLQLEGCLRRARTSLDAQPPRWSELIGTVSTRHAPPERRHDVVDRELLRERIDVLLRVTDEARRLGGRLLFYGE